MRLRSPWPLCAFLALACGPPGDDSASRPAPVPPVPLAHVGSAVCAECHAPEAEAWRGSHHDLAMQPATPETVLGDFSGVELAIGGERTRFYRDGDVHRVRVTAPDGEVRDLELPYVFGVEPLQQVLADVGSGRLQALAWSWDSRPAGEGGQRWFHLYADDPPPPGDELHWSGRGQNWNHMCAECHSTGLEKGYVAAEDRFATTWAEIDVACEACHGPGSRHVAWAEARGAEGEPYEGADTGLTVRLGDDDGGAWEMVAATGIARRVPPRTGSPSSAGRAEVETCGRCHSRRATLAEGVPPGRPLLDSHRVELLAEDLYHPDGQPLDEVYVYGSFLQSRMYAAGVSCRDCHEPHSARLLAEGDALCGRCHLAGRFDTPEHHHHPAGSAGAACVECHMPAKSFMEIDDRREHAFRVPRPALAARVGAPDACTSCHADRATAWVIDAWSEWYGEPEEHFGEVLLAARAGEAAGPRRLRELAGDRAEAAIVRATAVAELGEVATPAAVPAIEAAAGAADPLLRFAAALAGEGLPGEELVRVVGPLAADPVRAVRQEAARVLAAVPAERLPAGVATDLEAALAELHASLRLHRDRPESRLLAGLLHARRGDLEAAESEYRAALALDPDLVPAVVNLADLRRLQGRDAEGEELLLEALATSPDSADLEHALGLLLVREKRLGEAMERLGRAVELDPGSARYAYVWAAALHQEGRSGEALEVLAEARRESPGAVDLLQAEASIALASGRGRAAARAAAREWAKRYPDDPRARSLLGRLSDGVE